MFITANASATTITDFDTGLDNGKIIFVNEAFASLYGYTHPRQLVGKQATDLICHEFKEQFSRIYEAIISGISKERIVRIDLSI